MSFESALDNEIRDLQLALQADPRFIKLQELKRVRALYRPPNVTVAKRDDETTPATAARLNTNGNLLSGIVADLDYYASAAAATDSRSGRKPSPQRIQALLIAKEAIRGKNEPTRTSDIFAKIRDAGIHIGGADPQNNLSAMLHNSDDFRSHGRAGWTLASP